MTPRELAEIMVFVEKIKIESNPFVSQEEKEVWKQFLDYLKHQIPTDAHF